jgi:hypothetical protein
MRFEQGNELTVQTFGTGFDFGFILLRLGEFGAMAAEKE